MISADTIKFNTTFQCANLCDVTHLRTCNMKSTFAVGIKNKWILDGNSRGAEL